MLPLALWAGGFLYLHLSFAWTCRGDANPGAQILRASIEYFSAESLFRQEHVYGYWDALFMLCRVGLTLEFLFGLAFVLRPDGSPRRAFVVPFAVLLLIRLHLSMFAFDADYWHL